MSNVIQFSLALDRMGIKRVHKCDGPCCRPRRAEHITLEGGEVRVEYGQIEDIVPEGYKGGPDAA